MVWDGSAGVAMDESIGRDWHKANIEEPTANVRFWGSQKDGTVRSTMLKRETFTIQTIYVPVKRRRTLDPKRASRGSTPTGGRKSIGRADDRRLPCRRA